MNINTLSQNSKSTPFLSFSLSLSLGLKHSISPLYFTEIVGKTENWGEKEIVPTKGFYLENVSEGFNLKRICKKSRDKAVIGYGFSFENVCK